MAKKRILFLLWLVVSTAFSFAFGYSENIIVLDFIGYDMQPEEALEFSDYLRIELEANSNLRVVNETDVNRALAELDISRQSVKDADTAVRIGKFMNADKVIMGKVSRFTKFGEYFYITADMVDVATGEIIFSKSLETGYKYKFKDTAERLSQTIAERLGYRVEKARERNFKPLVFDDEPRQPTQFWMGLGYPYLSVIWKFSPQWSIEPRIALGSDILAAGSRVNYILKVLDKFEVYTGAETYYITFNTNDLKGWGLMIEAYLGSDYKLTRDLRFSLDIGPAYVFLSEEEGYSISVMGDWVVNMGIKIFLFGL